MEDEGMKTKQAVNPYLPSWEYVPDAEPHIVDGRVYIYGSHDLFNGLISVLETMYAGQHR
mgnify:CR=1 FL=1